MASQTLRPHRSPSPSPAPSTPVNPSNPAKLTRQSLGPPPTSNSGSARGFSGLGAVNNGAAVGGQPRHVSSSVALGMGSTGRDSLSPRPGFNNSGTPRAVSSNFGRPSSEFLPHGRDAKTPESEQIDQWFQHLADWEHTLEEMAAASTDQNFTEELGAIEQWFRVLSEAERTAALYSLLQHSTPVQIRFFLNVLQHMAQSDPMTALLSPMPSHPSMQSTMESRLAGMNMKSPSAGGGSGFPGSPTVSNMLGSDPAVAAANKSKLRQNRISAPGTLQPSDRWQGQLDQVVERGMSPGIESEASSRSRSPGAESRPKSTDFSGQVNNQGGPRSPRHASGLGLGLAQPELSSPVGSPFINGSWASMSNTPLVPMFTDPRVDGLGAALNLANLQLGQSPAARVSLDDPRKYRRAGAAPTGRNVSGTHADDGEHGHPGSQLPGRATSPLAGGLAGQNWTRSPLLDQYGLGGLGIGGTDAASLAGLGMNMANFNNMMGGMNPAQMLALAQAQQQLSSASNFGNAGYGGQGGLGMPRASQGRPATTGRRSPMLGSRNSPTPDRGNAMNNAAAGAGGGAGGGAGVAGPDDIDERILADTSNWLRVLRLHKYTTNFASSTWKQMANMTDQDLLDKGVSAQGARTKFLKVFYNVRTHFNMPHPEGSEEYAPGKDDEAK